jgi:hypothetical protein
MYTVVYFCFMNILKHVECSTPTLRSLNQQTHNIDTCFIFDSVVALKTVKTKSLICKHHAFEVYGSGRDVGNVLNFKEDRE